MADAVVATPRRTGRSVLAVVAGILVGALLSLGTDEVLHLTRVYPSWGVRMSDPLFGLATAYRVVFSVLGSWVIARLAPRRPMLHAMIAGAIGLVVSAAGAAATWNRDLGPHWYNVAVAAMALPCAWIGAKIYELQGRT
jgi:hypothetical protein